MRRNEHWNTPSHDFDDKAFSGFGGRWNRDSGDHQPAADSGDAGTGKGHTAPTPASGNPGTDNHATTPDNGGGHTPAGNSGAETTTPTSASANDFAHQLLTLTNAFRAEHGVAALQWDDKLALAAQQHTQDMANNHYFSHTQPDGDTLTDRLHDVGYQYSSAGENIAMGQTTPEAVMQAWENSDGHRANLLNAHFTEFGAGYVDAAQDLWTQDFGSEYA